MSADDNDPRHLYACRNVLSRTTEMLTENRKRNAVLVAENDLLRTERDQLAARVEELDDEVRALTRQRDRLLGERDGHLLRQCTPEKRAVLEAIKRDHPTLYAHEANRAAKAKRGGA